MRYLINTTEVYRVSSEEEATRIIEEAKNNSAYTLSKYTSQYKEKKSKGEIIDYYWKVTLTKEFTSEKEPSLNIEVSYNVDSAF